MQPVLNISPVSVPDTTIRVGLYPYDPEKGHERLGELRKALRATHTVVRWRDSIACIQRTDDAPEHGESSEDLPTDRNLGLVKALLRDALIDALNELERPVVSHEISFLANRNLLADALPEDITSPDWLCVAPRYTLDARLFFFDKRKPFLGIALDARTRRRITAPCSTLLDAGVDLQDLYVVRRESGDDPRLEPRLILLGRVAQNSGGQLELADSRDGIESIASADCFLEPSITTFNNVFDQVFGADAVRAKEALASLTAARRVGPAKLEDLKNVLAYFRREPLPITPDLEVSLGPLFARQDVPRLAAAPRPTYVFDPTGGKTDTWADGGLQKYGPYSLQTFSKNRPRIAVVCQGKAKGRVEQFLHKFFNGQRHPKKDRGPFDNGLIGKYRLDGVSPKFFLAENASASAYAAAVEQAISEEDRWDLALVQIERQFRELDGANNPYVVTKHAFLAHQTPVQEFTLETADLWPGQLAYALNNMGLATYSKLGGTPWLLRSDRTIAHELVVGVGWAEMGEGRLGGRERYVGFTAVFSGDGDYRVSNQSKAVPFENYQEELLSTLRATVQTVSEDMNWQPGDHVRLVFHAFKPFRDVEATAVRDLMDSLGDYDVDYAFVEISEQHPYLLFDENQKGARDFETRMQKGVFAPDRGTMLRLSDREILISLTGPRDVKRPEDGLPSPVLLRLHRDSTFSDTTYLARQVYAFANHSWKSFFPGSLPVTVLYPKLIAGLLGEMSRLPNWNADVLWGRIGRSRWFL